MAQDNIVKNVNVRDAGGKRRDVRVELLRFATVDEFEPRMLNTGGSVNEIQ